MRVAESKWDESKALLCILTLFIDLIRQLIVRRAEQFSKFQPPISVTELGISMACNDLQPMKHLPLIFVTELGMLMACSEVQPQKAQSPISVTESGMSTACSEEFPSKAASPISVTELGMEYVFILPFAGNCKRVY